MGEGHAQRLAVARSVCSAMLSRTRCWRRSTTTAAASCRARLHHLDRGPAPWARKELRPARRRQPTPGSTPRSPRHRGRRSQTTPPNRLRRLRAGRRHRGDLTGTPTWRRSGENDLPHRPMTLLMEPAPRAVGVGSTEPVERQLGQALLERVYGGRAHAISSSTGAGDAPGVPIAARAGACDPRLDQVTVLLPHASGSLALRRVVRAPRSRGVRNAGAGLGRGVMTAFREPVEGCDFGGVCRCRRTVSVGRPGLTGRCRGPVVGASDEHLAAAGSVRGRGTRW